MKLLSWAGAFFALAVWFHQPACAATINLSVNPLVEEMRVPPGSTGRTFTMLTNNGDVDERVSIEPIDWTTRLDGSIALQNVGAQGAFSLTRGLEPMTYGFVLHAHEQRRLEVALAVKEGHQQRASTWGGILIRAAPLDRSLAIGPAATFFIYNDSRPVKRHLSIQRLYAIPGRPAGTVQINALLKNDGHAYARTGGTLTIYRSGTIEQRQDIPVGVIFPGHLRTIQYTARRLDSGKYTIELKFDYGGDVIVAGETTVVIR